MTTYALYNLGLAGLALLLSTCVRSSLSPLQFALAARVGLLTTLFAYPWDFFAIRLGVWRYPRDPGLVVYGVPVNDLIFMWLCTYVATVFLTWDRARNSRRKRHPERQHAREQNA